MKLLGISVLGLALPGLVYGCDGHTHARRNANDGHEHSDGHGHGHSAPPKGQLTPPTRPLEWGDINIIHTTDSHGWLLGHQKAPFPEPNYSGDLGDFASFVTHMREAADKRGVDLLLVDSGDLHDGTGLTDGFPPGGVDAHDANQFLKMLPYDVMAIGNHELYIYENALDMHQNFAPALKGRYLSSNVNITVPGPSGQNVSVPIGGRFSKFRTKFGRKITALGVLFDFDDNATGTTVQKVADMVNETWFKEAIREEPDVFLLVGHMPVARDNWPLVFDAVRAIHPTTPILILGGHTHIRDCLQLDGRSMSLESGRYMETVGWMSAKLDKKGSTKDLHISRRYLDTNRVTYEFHTRTNEKSFDTSLGERISSGLQQLSARFNLDAQFGIAPQDYFRSSVPYPSNNSLLSLYIGQVIPTVLKINNSEASKPALFITNSGSLRFDLYAGPFTRNDQFTTSSFPDSFLYLPNIPLSIAEAAVNTLNDAGANERRSLSSATGVGLAEMVGQYYDTIKRYAKGDVDSIYQAWLMDMDKLSGIERREMVNLTLGYVTQDSCPGVGDDILHAPLPFFSTPDFIASDPPSDVSSDSPIDFVFVDFIQDQLLEIVNGLQKDKVYTAADAQRYSDILASATLGIFAEQMWN